MLKLRPRTNGQSSMEQAEQDDAEDKLAERLAEDGPLPFVPDDQIPTLPPMPQPTVQRAPQQPQRPERPKETVNVKDLMETLLEAWTNPTVRMWVDGADLCFEQVNLEKREKNTWRVGFSHVRTSSVKLLK
mgnify:CR=1 FL=1